MTLNIITSPHDGDFNPVAHYEWQVSKGLIVEIKDYDREENISKNKNLVKGTRKLIKKLQNIDEDTEPEFIAEAFDEFDLAFVNCDFYTKESSDAICDLLDFFMAKNEILEEFDEEDLALDERFRNHYIEILNSPQMPRPVLWHLVNKFLINDFMITGENYSNYLGHAITENPICGDELFNAYCKSQYPDREETFSVLGTNQTFWNPSLSLSALEKLDFSCISQSGDFTGSDFIHYDSDKFDFERFDLDISISESEGLDLIFSDFVLVLARVLDEMKLGRLSIERLATSKNIFLRTILCYWTNVDQFLRMEAEKLGVIDLNSETSDFIKYCQDNPYVSAINLDLANKNF